MHTRVELPGWVRLVAWLLLMGVSQAPAPSMAAEERIALIDMDAAAKAHQAFLLGGGGEIGITPKEQATEAVADPGRKLRTLQGRLSRDASRLSEAERTALKEQITQEIVALQEQYSLETKALFERRKWASVDILMPYVQERVKEFGKARGLPVIVTRSDELVLYRDPARAVGPTAERVDLTQAFIDWLQAHAKDHSPAPPAEAPASGAAGQGAAGGR